MLPISSQRHFKNKWGEYMCYKCERVLWLQWQLTFRVKWENYSMMSPKFLSSSNNLLFNNFLKIEAMAYVFSFIKRVPSCVSCFIARREVKKSMCAFFQSHSMTYCNIKNHGTENKKVMHIYIKRHLLSYAQAHKKSSPLELLLD